MKKEIIKNGEKFGRLTAVSFSHMTGTHQVWNFLCNCGSIKKIRIDDIRLGKTKSCGCLKKELMKNKFKTHGMSGTKIYATWCAMKERCINSNSKDYNNYGGRGIKVCKKWLMFENFYNDMGKCPKGKSLDRVDNSKNYIPYNCRWSTNKEQANNRRNNHLLTFNGETKTVVQWANKLKVAPDFLYRRIYRGWSVERTLSTSKQ